MSRLGETRGTRFELVRHFLRRMVDGEWSSGPGQWQPVAASAFAFLLPAGVLLLDPRYAAKYRGFSALPSPDRFRAAALADELSLLTLAIAITGMLALLAWHSLFPTGRDYLALAGLPVRPRDIFIARFASVLLFSTAIVIAMNLLPTFFAPLVFVGRWQKNPSYLVNFVAQGISSGLACFFVFFALVALQGVLLNTLPGRLFLRFSSYAQGVLMAALLLAALYSGSIGDWGPKTMARLPQFGAWLPPVWFAGLHEYLQGDRDPFLTGMAVRAGTALLAAMGLTVLTYLISYRRYRKLLVEAPVWALRRRDRRWSLIRLVAREPQREAIMRFMATTMARSRSHRMIWLAYLGGAAAVMLNSSIIDGAVFAKSGGVRPALQFAAVFWPLGASVILLNGFRHVVSIPAELPANWIFQLTENQGRAYWMSAVERFVQLYAIVPIYLLVGPITFAVFGWAIAARMTVFQVLVSLTLFEILFYSWQQLPFTCSYVPGKKPLVGLLAKYMALLTVFVPLVSMIITAMSQFLELFLLYLPVFGGLWWFFRRRRREGWGEAKILYEELPRVVATLGLRG